MPFYIRTGYIPMKARCLSNGFQRTFVCEIVTKPQNTEPMFEIETLVRRVKMRTQCIASRRHYASPTALEKEVIFCSHANIVQIMFNQNQ